MSTGRAQQGSSVSRKRECKAMKFVEDTSTCEVRSSELVFCFFYEEEPGRKQVEDCGVLLKEDRVNPKGLGCLFSRGYFHFSFLSLWLILTCP